MRELTTTMACRNTELADALRAICKRFDVDTNMSAEDAAKNVLEALERDWMRLPVDADGVPIRPGDRVYGYGRKEDGMTVRFLDQHGNLMVGDTGTTNLRDCLYWTAEDVTHHKPDTVESLLEEFHGKLWSDDEEQMALLEEYAERIRKACNG